jgi:hypothetical protein
MNLFKKIFSKEKEKEIKQKKEDSNAFALDPLSDLDDYLGPVIGCAYCNEEIKHFEKRTTKGKDKFHVKCYRKFKKQVKRIS